MDMQRQMLGKFCLDDTVRVLRRIEASARTKRTFLHSHRLFPGIDFADFRLLGGGDQRIGRGGVADCGDGLVIDEDGDGLAEVAQEKEDAAADDKRGGQQSRQSLVKSRSWRANVSGGGRLRWRW